jgi:HSP20 family protein
MATNTLIKSTEMLPSFINTLFNPLNEWFDSGFERTLSLPAVNIVENEKDFRISVAAPGMKKEDFKIGIDGDVLTISAEREENIENEKYNRREFNYSSFSRSFTMPNEVMKEKIEAKYEDGVLKLMLPKNEGAKVAAKTIAVK